MQFPPFWHGLGAQGVTDKYVDKTSVVHADL